MKQKIPHYGIWFIRGQGGRADEDSLVLLSSCLRPHLTLLWIQKMDVDMWICGYSLLPDMPSPGRSLPYESPNGFPNVVTRVTQF